MFLKTFDGVGKRQRGCTKNHNTIVDAVATVSRIRNVWEQVLESGTRNILERLDDILRLQIGHISKNHCSVLFHRARRQPHQRICQN